MKKLGPGIYADDLGRLHVDVPQVLRELGAPDTPHNREIVAEAAAEIARANGIPVTEAD